MNASTISVEAKKCLALFESKELSATLKDTTAQPIAGINREITLLTIDDARARYRAWGTNIAAFHASGVRTSLDSRLKEAPSILSRTLHVLKDLREYLTDVSLIVSGQKVNEVWSLADSSDSSDSSEEERSIKGEEDEGESTSSLQELLKAILASISSLMKLSILIRSSPNRDDYVKAASRYNTWSAYPDISHVREKYGSSTYSQPWLLDRLGKTITRRRQFLKYRVEHHEKMTVEKEVFEMPERPDKSMVASTKATTFVGAESNIPNAPKPVSEVGSFGSLTSYDPTVFGMDGAPTLLTVPSPPKMAFPDVEFVYGEPFQCPYCFTEQIVRNKSMWKKHVFRDLKPYVCTFEGCSMLMFKSRKEWFSHELKIHRRDWSCQYCECNSFSTKDEFSAHTKAAHPSILANSSLEALLLQSEEQAERIPATACHLCNDWEEDLRRKEQSRNPQSRTIDAEKIYGQPKQFRRHLGRHMEQMALFALPQNGGDDGLDDDSSQDGGSELEDIAEDDIPDFPVVGEQIEDFTSIPSEVDSDELNTIDQEIQSEHGTEIPSALADEFPGRDEWMSHNKKRLLHTDDLLDIFMETGSGKDKPPPLPAWAQEFTNDQLSQWAWRTTWDCHQCRMTGLGYNSDIKCDGCAHNRCAYCDVRWDIERRPQHENVNPAATTPFPKSVIAINNFNNISTYFHTEILPWYGNFSTSSHEGVEQMNFERKKLRDTTMYEVFLKLDALTTDGDNELEQKRTDLIEVVRGVLRRIDAVRLSHPVVPIKTSESTDAKEEFGERGLVFLKPDDPLPPSGPASCCQCQTEFSDSSLILGRRCHRCNHQSCVNCFKGPRTVDEDALTVDFSSDGEVVSVLGAEVETPEERRERWQRTAIEEALSNGVDIQHLTFIEISKIMRRYKEEEGEAAANVDLPDARSQRMELETLRQTVYLSKSKNQEQTPSVNPTVPSRMSDIWSTQEVTVFPMLLKRYGSDWYAISRFLGTKTITMVKDFYEDQVSIGNRIWKEFAMDADTKRANGIPTDPLPHDFLRQLATAENLENTDTGISSGHRVSDEASGAFLGDSDSEISVSRHPADEIHAEKEDGSASPPKVTQHSDKSGGNPEQQQTYLSQLSSNWSIEDQVMFPELLKRFGTDWVSIAAFLPKTETQVKEFYERQSNGMMKSWKQYAMDADENKAQGTPNPRLSQEVENRGLQHFRDSEEKFSKDPYWLSKRWILYQQIITSREQEHANFVLPEGGYEPTELDLEIQAEQVKMEIADTHKDATQQQGGNQHRISKQEQWVAVKETLNAFHEFFEKEKMAKRLDEDNSRERESKIPKRLTDTRMMTASSEELEILRDTGPCQRCIKNTVLANCRLPHGLASCSACMNAKVTCSYVKDLELRREAEKNPSNESEAARLLRFGSCQSCSDNDLPCNIPAKGVSYCSACISTQRMCSFFRNTKLLQQMWEYTGEILYSSDDDEAQEDPVPSSVPISKDAIPVDEEPYIIKCICPYTDDDGHTIYCDKCDTWQHISCYYFEDVEAASRANFEHSCRDCKPRQLDSKAATERQRERRRIERMLLGKIQAPVPGDDNSREEQITTTSATNASIGNEDGEEDIFIHYSCFYCPRTFLTRPEQQEHATNFKHTFRCAKKWGCQWSFEAEEELFHHYKTDHPTVTPGTNDPWYGEYPENAPTQDREEEGFGARPTHWR